MTQYYLTHTEDEASAIGAALFQKLLAKKRAEDPEVVTSEGGIRHRHCATRELVPEVPVSTNWSRPVKVVGGYSVPVPSVSELQLEDPARFGAQIAEDLIRWPNPDEELVFEWRPEGNYSKGTLVSHNNKIWLHISDKQGAPDNTYDIAAMSGDWIPLEELQAHA